MEDNIYSRNKHYFLPILIFLPINFLIFITPIKLSFFTAQYILLSYYLILFFTATFSPSLIVFGIRKKHAPSLIMLSLLVFIPIFLYVTNNIFENLKTNKNYTAESSSEGIELEIKRVESIESLLSNNFCFGIYLPEYLPATPHQMYFYDAIGSAKECDKQVMAILYNPSNMTITEIPRNYDFDFRKGFEDIKGLRDKALAGEKVDLDGKTAYLVDIQDIFEGFRPPPKAVSKDPAKLLYFEIEDTLIFFKFEPSTAYDKETFFDIAKSLKLVN